ncbi:hypothetical protein L195_g017644 [Trifolium pratense]|uniref:Transcriptional coactivator Hfi1/Transcriptional adapter 1 n=1 Tax=Trifolium pratense TaxID=57577 RepID=A0A2K3MUG7_TRIPR|nr:uncharacterized protein LOC123902561 [Trifolium pratense]PNX94468.1 hypothetical protein L195_g017644 [Trifolium pratense]
MTVPKRNYTRINALELKALIIRKVGRQRAGKYFDQLGKLVSSKISKTEFNKICILTIGKENIPLHNQLIKAILNNVCLAKVPPLRGAAKIGSLNAKDPNQQQTKSMQMRYGDAFPPSLRKGGSFATHEGRLAGRQNVLGQLGKPRNPASKDFIYKTPEQQSATELNSLGSRPPISVEDGEEVEQIAGSPSIQSRSPVTAPLGISMNFGYGRSPLSNASSCRKYPPETCYNNGYLPDTSSLRSRLEQKLEKEGLTATVDCVNLLNNALDSYMKRLIESSTGLSGPRIGNEHRRQQNGQSLAGSNILQPRRYIQTATQSSRASLLDFRVAMELNPQSLGPDWPTQLEKICIRASEE